MESDPEVLISAKDRNQLTNPETLPKPSEKFRRAARGGHAPPTRATLRLFLLQNTPVVADLSKPPQKIANNPAVAARAVDAPSPKWPVGRVTDTRRTADGGSISCLHSLWRRIKESTRKACFVRRNGTDIDGHG